MRKREFGKVLVQQSTCTPRENVLPFSPSMSGLQKRTLRQWQAVKRPALTKHRTTRWCTRNNFYWIMAFLVVAALLNICMLMMYYFGPKSQKSSSPFLDQSSGMIPSQSSSSCALLFFGLPRLFRKIVLPSLRTFVFPYHKHCDIYIHTM